MKSVSHYLLCLSLSFLAGCGANHSPESNSTPSPNAAPPVSNNGVLTFNSPRRNYTILRTTRGILVRDLVGTDGDTDASTATTLVFNDVKVSLTVGGLASSIDATQLQKLIELYVAFFNRLPDADGMAYWITQIRNGKTIDQIAESFYLAGIAFPELTGYSSQMSNADFVKIIYKNVLGRTGNTAPSDSEVQYWVGNLSSGSQTKSSLVGTMINSARTFANDPTYGWVAQLLDNKLKLGKHIAIEEGISYLGDTQNIQKLGAIAQLITPNSNQPAIELFGLDDSNFNLLASLPSAPGQLTTTANDSGGAISFTAPSNDGGLAITNYQASCSLASGSGTITSSGKSSPLIITGLSNGQTYSCQLFSMTPFGTSVGSELVKLTPLADSSLGNFAGNIVLGTPTDTYIKANIFNTTQNGFVSIRYGTNPGQYTMQTEKKAIQANQPVELSLTGLRADTQYYYRLDFQSSNGVGSGPSIEYSFQSARSPGQSFTFALQGDSHPERERSQFDGALYTRTLQTVANDRPDFYVMLGDDFSVDTLDPKTINAAQVTERYTIQRPYLGIIGPRTPIFLVNGNHEQAARFNLNGTPDSIAVWAQNARNSHYSQPAPDYFYSGNKEIVPFIGLLRNYYAWTWGDALFVVIDPYWESPVAVDNVFGGEPKRTNMWDVTHGDDQYLWLKDTLEKSKAKYKFVFAHHVMGTGRGGIELAGLWEWGGKNAKGVNEFATQRPRWNLPIHQLMVANKVTIFFQGHDHIWVHQQLDGVTYQSLSEPADPNYALWNSDAYLTGERFPSTGYTRVQVAPTGVKVEYVRTYLPKDEGVGKLNGAPVFSYTINNP